MFPNTFQEVAEELKPKAKVTKKKETVEVSTLYTNIPPVTSFHCYSPVYVFNCVTHL